MRRRQRGFLLISLYMLLPLLLIMVGAIISYAWSDVRANLRTQASTQAFYFAEAGLDNTIVQLRKTGAWSATSGLSVGSYGNYSVAVQDLGNNFLRLTSTGTSTYLTAPIAQALESIVQVTTSGDFFHQAIFGDQSVLLSDDMKTDSYLSSKGPYSAKGARSKGNVGTNETVDLSGNATVHGNVYVSPTGNPEEDIHIGDASVVITGVSAAATDPVVLKDVTVPDGLTNQGSLKLSGTSTKTLAGGTYLYDNIKISGKARLNFMGPTTIYLTNKLTASGNAKIIAAGNLPPNLLIYVLGPTVEMSGNAILYGGIYAPVAAADLSGNAILYGGLMAQRGTVRKNGTIHYDEDLPNSTLTPQSTKVNIRSWGVAGDLGPPSSDPLSSSMMR